MKAGLRIVALCIVVGSIGGAVMLWNTQKRIRESQDIVLGLTYFMEQHAGRLPASESEFLSSPFVETVSDTDSATSIRIRPYDESQYRHDPHGVTIANLDEYKIAWGTELSGLTYDAQGELRDEKGNGVKLIRWPTTGYGSGSPAAARYADLLLTASRDIRRRSTSQPASAPAEK